MPAAKHAFVLTIDHSSAQAEAQKWASAVTAVIEAQSIKLPELQMPENIYQVFEQLEARAAEVGPALATGVQAAASQIQTSLSGAFKGLGSGANIQAPLVAYAEAAKMASKSSSELAGHSGALKSSFEAAAAGARKLGTETTSQSRRLTSQIARWESLSMTLQDWIGDVTSVASTYASTVAQIQTSTEAMQAGLADAFAPLIESALQAHTQVVGGSYIPAMVEGVIHWIDTMKTAEEGAFDPMIMEAKHLSEEMVKAFRTMRFPAGARGEQGEPLGGRMASLDQLKQYFEKRGVIFKKATEQNIRFTRAMDVHVDKSKIKGLVTIEDLPDARDPKSIAGAIARHHKAMQKQFDLVEDEQTRAKKLAKEQKKIFEQLTVAPEKWAKMGGIEKYSAGIQAAQRRAWGMRGFGYQMAGYGRGMMMAGGAALGGLGATAKEYMDLNRPLERAARNLEANREQTEALDYALRQMAGSVSALKPEEQADLLFKWATATGAQVKSQDDLNQILVDSQAIQQLTKLGFIDQSQAVEITTDILSMYGKHTSETTDVVAKLITVAARSKAEVDDLGQAFSMVGGFADMANVSFEETAAVLNILAAYGQRGSRAGRGLARVLENLIAPSDKARAALDAVVGEGAFIDAEGKFIGIAGAVRVLAEATGEMEEAQRTEFLATITTQNALRVLLPLMDMQLQARERGIDAIDAEINLLEGLEDAGTRTYVSMREAQTGYAMHTQSAMETMNQQWTAYTESLTGQADMAKARWAAFVDTVGKSLATVIVPAISEYVEKFGTLIALLERHPELVRGAAVGAGAILAIGATVTALGKVVAMAADILMWKAARAMVIAADKNLLAAKGMDAAATKMGGTSFFTKGPAKGGGAGGAVVAGGIAVMTALIVGNVISSLATEKDLYDLFSVKEEKWAAVLEAEQEASEMERTEAEVLLEKAKEERLALEAYAEKGVVAVRKIWEGDTSGLEFEDVPDEYKAFTGKGAGEWLISTKLIESDWVEVQAQIDALENRLQELQIASQKAAEETRGDIRQARADAAYAQNEARRAIREQAFQARMAVDWGPARDPYPMEYENYLLEEQARRLREQRIQIAGVKAEMWEKEKALLSLAEALGINIEQLRIFGREVGTVRLVLGEWDLSEIEQAIKMVTEFIPSSREVATQAGEAARGGLAQFHGLLDIMSPAQIEEAQNRYLEGLVTLYQEVEGQDQRHIDFRKAQYDQWWSDWISGEKEAVRERERLAEEHNDKLIKMQEKIRDAFKSEVEAGLTPTSVTAEDVAKTDMGTYEDKWDEYVRQLRAAMQGSAEWKHLLPSDMEMRNDQKEINAWGEERIRQFYQGMLPEHINWDAFARDFERRIAEKIGKQNLVKTAIEELKKRGITATRQDVMQALGLTSEFENAFFGGATPEQAGKDLAPKIEEALGGVQVKKEAVDPLAGQLSGHVSTGFKDDLEDVDWVPMFTGAVQGSIDKKKTDLEKLGERIGTPLWEKIVDVGASGFVDAFIDAAGSLEIAPGDLDDLALEFLEASALSFQNVIGGVGWTESFVSTLQGDLEEKQESVRGIGTNMLALIWEGLSAQMQTTDTGGTGLSTDAAAVGGSMFEQMFFGGQEPETVAETLSQKIAGVMTAIQFGGETLEPLAESMVSTMTHDIQIKLGEYTWTEMFASAMEKDLVRSKGAGLKRVGRGLVAPIWTGVKERFGEHDLIDLIVMIVMEKLAERMGGD